MIPFIDVGLDWIEPPACVSVDTIHSLATAPKQHDTMQLDNPTSTSRALLSLQDFLESTPWWVSRRGMNVKWDGQSAFVETISKPHYEEGIVIQKPSRMRSLKKKDLYAAWNAMMHTPRFVRRKLRRSNARTSTQVDRDTNPSSMASGEYSIGETVVWRRFMDQVSEISFKADSKRLGGDQLHDLFGEFRHYVVEKHAYSMANRFSGNDPTDVSWFFVYHVHLKKPLPLSNFHYYSGQLVFSQMPHTS